MNYRVGSLGGTFRNGGSKRKFRDLLSEGVYDLGSLRVDAAVPRDGEGPPRGIRGPEPPYQVPNE